MSSLISTLKQPSTDEILRFVRGLNPYRPSAAGDGKEKVTSAGLGLTPSDRLAVERFYKQRAHTEVAVAERHNADSTLLKDGEKDTTSIESQLGTPYHSESIIQRLKKLNENFIFERSNAFPEIIGIYLPDENAEIRDGKRLRHVIGFEFGYSPEYTVFHKETKGPKKVTRGWRTLLLLLASRGLINFTRACALFSIEGVRNSYNWKREVGNLKRV